VDGKLKANKIHASVLFKTSHRFARDDIEKGVVKIIEEKLTAKTESECCDEIRFTQFAINPLIQRLVRLACTLDLQNMRHDFKRITASSFKFYSQCSPQADYLTR